MSWLSDLLGGKDDEPKLPTPPDFYTDQNYQNEQDFLQPYGQGLLTGQNIPDFYKSIATQDSPEFENALGLSNRDIEQSAAESAARTGRGRGGSLSSVTAQAVGDNSSKLRYADFLNSNEGKKFLMQQGVGISESVRNAGQAQGEYRNHFNEWQYGQNKENALFDINRADKAAAAEGSMMGKIGSIALPVAGGIGGFFLGGPAGAVTGAQLGSTIAGGLSGNQSSIQDLFKAIPDKSAGTTPGSAASEAAGVSSIGAIDTSGSQITDLLKQAFGLK